MKHLNFKLFLFPFLLILFTSNAFSEIENGNTCNEAQALLPAGLFAASDSGSSGIGDKDYFSFTVPANGELNVTITNTNASANNAPKLDYSTLTLGSAPCITAVKGTLNASISNTETVSITTAGTYYIFLEGTRNNTATTYNISALFTPNAPSSGIDLSITKTGSVDSLLIFDTFFYTINVSNVGDTNVSNVTVTDNLPPNMTVDLDATHAALASDGWLCSEETITTTCTLTGDLIVGSLSSIELHVKAPPTDGTITNEVNVTSSADGITIDTDVNPSNNLAIEITEVVSDIDTADHICYYERTEILNPDVNTSCEKKGNFYYGNGCDAYVTIMENNITDILSSPKIYKMYAPATSSGSCTYTAEGSNFGPLSKTCNNISNSNDFGSYEDGYAIIIDQNNTSNLEVDIKDTDTDHNPRIDGIAMFGDYYLEKTVGVTALRFHHTGRIFECTGLSEGGIEITSSADVIDTLITDAATATNYNTSVVPNDVPFDPTDGNIKYIQTMVATDQTREIVGVYLDLAGLSTPYIYDGSENFIPYSITPYLTDNDCNDLFENIIDPVTGEQLVIDIPKVDSNGVPLTSPPYYSASKPMIVSEVVRKNARIQMIFIDPNTLSVEGQQCLANSSTTGNFARLAQCVNSEVQYKTAFGQDAWDRCGEGNGNPCISANHGYSCGENDTTCDEYNPIYDNELGCYMCTFDIQPSCSTDNFAIRPDRFDVRMPDPANPANLHPDAPNLLRAGQEYGISLTAKNINIDSVTGTDTSLAYNVVDASIFETNTTKYFKSNWTEIAPDEKMNGESNVGQIGNSSIISGLSNETSNSAVNPDPILNISYSDVGEVTFYVYDKYWAEVDNDDTPQDCNSTEHTYICGEQNLTFIPHHFAFAELNITNHAGPDSNFNYVADNRGMPTTNIPTRSPMAARVHTRIEARNKQDEITKNFREDGTSTELYYENNISVNQNVKIPTTRTLPNEPDAYLFGDDANESKIDNKRIGFGRTTAPEIDLPGTRNIKWDESTYPLEFNFKRELHKPENPFDVNGTYFSIAATSTYIDPDDGDTATIDGSRVGDKNASDSATAGTPCIAPPIGSCEHNNSDGNSTFYYGRTRSSELFYKQIRGDSVITPIAVDVYCDLGYTVCDGDFGIDTSSGEINEPDWWLSWDHDMDRGDGNVTIEIGTLLEGTGAPKLDNGGGEADRISIDITNDEGVDDNVTVIGYTTSRPMTVPIELVNNVNPASPSYTTTVPYTNSWLIYNKHTDVLLQRLPSPFYKVQFVGEAEWTGEGTTGHVMDVNASYRKSQSMDW